MTQMTSDSIHTVPPSTLDAASPVAATPVDALQRRRVGWGERLRRVFRTGIRATLERQLSRAYWRRFENRRGVDTAGSIGEEELGVVDCGFGYEPIDYLTLRQAFATLPGTCRDGIFVDFGCGKGRALMYAAMRGFRTVCGVEFNEQLATTARSNLSCLAEAEPGCWEVVHGDARDFFVPDEATVLFFYNPFGGQVLLQTLENVRRSLRRNPREVYIVYALPKFDANLMDGLPWLSAWQTVQTCNSDWEQLTIYRVDCDGLATDSDAASTVAGWGPESPGASQEECLHAH